MSEKILRIEEHKGGSSYGAMDGYAVVTDKQTIRVLIDNQQNCCEHWGYATTLDNPADFDGASLLGVKIVDDALDVHEYTEFDDGDDESYALFVNFETDRGVFQITLYNEHNGYYGHSVRVSSEQLTYEGGL